MGLGKQAKTLTKAQVDAALNYPSSAGERNLERDLAALVEGQDARGLNRRLRLLIADGRAQWQELDRRIAVFDAEFAASTKENEDAKRLATIPGVGVMIASALIAAIEKARAALPHLAVRETALGRWAKGLLARVHQNVAVVALANKLARIARAVLRRGETFTVKGASLAA